MASDALKECSALTQPFNKVATDMRTGSTLWDDLIARGAKMQRHFETTSSSMYAFFEVLQKLADLASGARGATRDIGMLLTKLAMRHRAIAKSLSQVSTAISDEFLKAFTTLCEDSRRTTSSLERDHDRDLKKWKSDLRKANETNLKLSKAANKKKAHSRDKEDLEDRLEEALQGSLEQYKEYEGFEQQYLRLAMLHERQHYCAMLNALKPIVTSEVALLDEIYHLQGLLNDTDLLTENPETLPEASILVVDGLQLDMNRLFREIQSRSSAVEDAMKDSDEKKRLRTSFISLVSGDSSNSAHSAQDMAEDNLSPNFAFTASSLSLVQDSIRMEPDGSSRSEDPTPDPGSQPAAEGLKGPTANPVSATTVASKVMVLPPPPALIGEQDSVSEHTICDVDDLPLPPPPTIDDDLPPPPPPSESPAAPLPDLPAPLGGMCAAWQPPGAAAAPTPASLPVSVKPRVRDRSSSLSQASALSCSAAPASANEHKRLFPPMPPPKTARRGSLKAPVPIPNRIARSHSTVGSVPVPTAPTAPENIYDVPRNMRQAPPVAERPTSAIYVPPMWPPTSNPCPVSQTPSMTPLAEPYTSVNDRWHPSAQQSNEMVYASVGSQLPEAKKPHSASDLRASYKLRTSQTDLYNQSFNSVHAVATLPRSRSVAGMTFDHYGRTTPSGRPRANTTHNPVNWQGATQSVDV